MVAGALGFLDSGFVGVRASFSLSPELALEPRIALLALGVDLRWRPFARTSSVTPTVRLGYGLGGVFSTVHIVAVAAGLEWREVLGGTFGFDVGSILVSGGFPFGTWGFTPMPTVNMYLGYAF